MSQPSQKIRGILEGLSDFWLLYFQDLDQLKALYDGTDTLVGQSYLDLLSTLLHNSLQDMPLFDKNYYKSVRIKETEIRFLQKANAAQNCYVYVAEDNIVHTQVLQNKVLDVSALLENGLDFRISAQRTFEFKQDPLNAYRIAIFGAQRSAFSVRTRQPLQGRLKLWLHDTGIHPPEFQLTQDESCIVVSYDGPAHTGYSTARVLVSALNLHPQMGSMVRAALSMEDAGDVAPVGTSGPVVLARQAVSPLDGYAVRHLEERFAGRFQAPRAGNWVDSGVEKGDILRLISGPTVGTVHEYVISVVRPDALYLEPGTGTLDLRAGNQIDFSVLREPEAAIIENEAIQASSKVVQQGVQAEVRAESRTLFAPTGNFSKLHKDDVLELIGLKNKTTVRILEVLNAQTLLLASASLVDELPIAWKLHSTLTAALFWSNATLEYDSETTAKLTVSQSAFVTPVAGTAIKWVRNGQLQIVPVLEAYSAYEVVVATTVTETETIELWGWADYIAPVSELTFPFIKSGSIQINARRLWDQHLVEEGTDYVIHEDHGQLQPLTVWRPDVDLAVTYQYRLELVGGSRPVALGHSGEFITTTAGVFKDLSANFTYQDRDQALEIFGVGTFIIKTVHSASIVEFYTDQRLLDKIGSLSRFAWRLYARGALTTDNVTTSIREIAFWAADVLVDNFNLYHSFGYLIQKFQASSEAYRSLIRGVFQLFMLGPTLERLESAVNTVVGLPVIREDGEILLGYKSGADAQGTDGYLNAATQGFTSASARFTESSRTYSLFIKTGLNDNKLYKIESVLSPTSVVLDAAVTADGPVSWELLQTPEQQVITSRTTYKFPRTIPLRAAVMDTANIGVKLFRAFEVLTDVFNVTDYVESPTWWERIQIPEALWPGTTATRRQSSPQLVENVIGAVDQACIGDPGFLIGADSTGFVPEPSTGILPLRHNIAFVVLDTWLKHHLFYVSFSSKLVGHLSADLLRDLEALVFVAKPAYTYIILSPTSAFSEIFSVYEAFSYTARSRFEETIEVFTPDELTIGGGWQIGGWYRSLHLTGTLPGPLSSTKYVLYPPQANTLSYLTNIVFTNLELPRTAITVENDGVVLDLTGVSVPNTDATYDAYGVVEPQDASQGGYSAELGDVYYALGMSDPRTRFPTNQNTLFEHPVQIIRRQAP